MTIRRVTILEFTAISNVYLVVAVDFLRGIPKSIC